MMAVVFAITTEASCRNVKAMGIKISAWTWTSYNVKDVGMILYKELEKKGSCQQVLAGPVGRDGYGEMKVPNII